MTIRNVVVTGAHSYLGQKVLKQLGELGGFDITGFITPWADDGGLFARPDIKYIKADLRKVLDEDAAAAVRNADFVLHFAWIRGKAEEKIQNDNNLIFESLKTHISSPEKLVFVSSVAASPETLSVYGRTKFKAANALAEFGAVVLVTGLIVDKEPKGPYKLLVSVVKKFPLSFRFSPNTVKVYPIRTDDFLRAVTTVLTGSVPSGTYRVFPSEAVDLNDFLRALEKKFHRLRVPIPVSYPLSMNALKLFRRLGLLPSGVGEKLLTFLYKDDEYLSKHSELSGLDDLDRPLCDLI